MLKRNFALLLFLLPMGSVFAQFTVKPTFFETTGVSNQGLVAGYESWGGPYSFWDADFNTTQVIGGMAPGNGVGGQARFSADGNWVSGTSMGFYGAEISRYEVSTQQWSPLGYLGATVDSTTGGGYCISGDGNTVVGNGWADTTGGFAFTHAVAWNTQEGTIDLGSLYHASQKSARANVVNGDGSVVAGWQDFNGPWKSAVWRKDPAGGYFPNTYILLDTNSSATDEFNQLGECTAVSLDGNWIGGAGDFANNGEPWIWSAATGAMSLGTLAPGAQGYVAGLNADGSVAVGRFSLGPFDPQIPFIWTQRSGLQDLNSYLRDSLGYALGTHRIYSANCMSWDGTYIAGYGVDDSTSQFFTFRAALPLTVHATAPTAPSPVKIYPNPATDWVTIAQVGSATVRVTDLLGRVISQTKIRGNHTLDIEAYPSGTYLLTLQSLHFPEPRTFKLIKR